MDLSSVGKLISMIAVHYPAFKRHVMDKDGRISKFIAEEWHRRLWPVSMEDALDRLDAYLAAEHEYAPDTQFFLQKPRAAEYFTSGRKPIYHVEHGWLVDEYGQVYGLPDNPDSKFMYDGMGRIVDDRGRIIQ